MQLDTEALRERLARVQDAVRSAARAAGRDADDVALVAVSKKQPSQAVATAFEAGQVDFGENYVQEAEAKREELRALDIRWHFIGGLQSNKARFVAGNYALIHSVDSIKLARELDKRAAQANAVQDILIQVNVACEDSKCGVLEEGLPELAEACEALENVRLTGLMTMPPFFDDPERARPFFSRLRKLGEELGERLGTELRHLSMGMSGDYVAAIEEGATLVRIGTDIFGPRMA